MGIRMDYVEADSNFKIRKENKQQALEAVKKLMQEASEKGSGYNPREGNVFSWMHKASPEKWETLEEAMAEWRFRPTINENGDITGLTFTGNKAGDEEHLFKAIAEYVENGCRLEFSYGQGGGMGSRIYVFHGTFVEVLE